MSGKKHIGFDDSKGARYAILPGDPGRVEKIAGFLDNPRFFAQNREYTTWIGELGGENVLVMSTGMGGPSTAICLEEMVQLGIDTFIRVGSCGGMADDVIGGDVVIATGTVRMEGTTREYVPIEFPAIADLAVTNALVQGAKDLGLKWHAGVVHCKDSYFGQHDPGRMPVGYELAYKWQAWLKAGCLASEMESAALYIVSQVLRARAGCILNVFGNQERAAKGMSNPRTTDTTPGIKCAVEAVKTLIASDKALG